MAGVPAAAGNRDAEVATVPIPRRGRVWIVLVLALGLLAFGYAIVEIATQKRGPAVVHLEGHRARIDFRREFDKETCHLAGAWVHSHLFAGPGGDPCKCRCREKQ